MALFTPFCLKSCTETKWEIDNIIKPKITIRTIPKIALFESESPNIPAIIIPLIRETRAEEDFSGWLNTALASDLNASGWHLVMDRLYSQCELLGIGQEIKNRVYRWTGIPIGVGISTTKTLAKLANFAGKKYLKTKGVVDLTSSQRQKRLMDITPVEEVWGVGRRLKKKLNADGIIMAGDLVACDRSWIKRNYFVALERTVCELQGESCLPWEEEVTGNKYQIIFSRSFGNRVTEKKNCIQRWQAL